MIKTLSAIILNLAMNDFIQVLVSALLSAGLTYFFGIRKLYTEAKLKFKAEKYSNLIKVMSEFLDNNPNEYKLGVLNEALFFASDEVVKEIKKFNILFTDKFESSILSGENRVKITSEDIKPLIIAIRTELNLGSESINEGSLSFFQKPKE